MSVAPGGQDREQADRAVAHDRDSLALAGGGSDCAEPRSTEHIGGCEQVRHH
jgi:hypothetical protein